MPSTYDPLLRLELQATGENATTWGTKTNNNLNLLAAAIAGTAIVSVSSGDTTLSTANAATDQARAAILLVQGTLTGAANIIVPPESKTYAVIRGTSGAFDVIVKNTGTGATLPVTGNEIIVCTSTTCYGIVGSLVATVSALDTRIAAVSASVSALNVQVAAVSALTSALDVRITDVSAAVSTLGVQVAAVSAQTSVLDSRISAVSASVSVINTQLAAVSALVSSLNSLDIRVIE
jgi:flagellin-like hook-associated protein FlgL